MFLSVSQFSSSGVSSLWLHELQHTRFPHPSPAPGACSNSCPSSQWCHPTISSSVIPFSSCLQSFPASRVFSSKSVLHISWPECWSFSFSISPSNEFSGLISFRKVQLIYNIVLVSGVSKVVQLYSFQILFLYRLLQSIEYNSLCHRVGPCCLSVLYIVVHRC